MLNALCFLSDKSCSSADDATLLDAGRLMDVTVTGELTDVTCPQSQLLPTYFLLECHRFADVEFLMDNAAIKSRTSVPVDVHTY